MAPKSPPSAALHRGRGSQRSSALASTGAQVVSFQGLGGLAVQKISPATRSSKGGSNGSRGASPARAEVAPRNSSKQSQVVKCEEPGKPFTLTCVTLAGAPIEVQAVPIDTVDHVRRLVASEIGMPLYRVSLSNAHGASLEKTLAKSGICDDEQLLVVIAEENKWREMSRDDFIELVVSRHLGARDELTRSLQSCKSEEEELEARERYIPRLEEKLRTEERQQKRAERARNMQDSVHAEIESLMSQEGAEAAAGSLRAKIVAVESTTCERVAVCMEIKEDAQRDLVTLMPMYESAMRALDDLEKKHICEIKAFAKPPPLVVLVCDAMCILFEERPGWDTTMKLLSDCRLIDRLRNYDKDNISLGIIRRLEPYLGRDEFDPANIRRFSIAAAAIGEWVIAMHRYESVARLVYPKREKLREAEEDLQDLTAEMDFLRKQLVEIEETIDKSRN